MKNPPNRLLLESPRLRLRPLELEDAELGVEMFTDERVTRYIDGVMPAAEIRAEMPTWVQRAADGTIGIWVIEDRESGEQHGTCCLLPIPVELDDTDWRLVVEDEVDDHDIEIGYILKPSAWGRGIATEAATRLLEFAFTETALEEVVAVIDDDNAASRNVLLKVGLRESGRRPAYGTEAPGFRIRREEWRQNIAT